MQRHRLRKHMVKMNLPEELTAVIEQFQAPLLRYAGRMLRNNVQAQDIVQDALIKFLQHRQDSDEPIRNVQAWLYRVTHNLALDYIRRYQRQKSRQDDLQAELEDAGIDDPATQLERRDAAKRAWDMLDVLNERERQIVTMKIVDEMSYKEIAAAMDLTVTNVGFILHKSMKKMAKAMRQEPA